MSTVEYLPAVAASIYAQIPKPSVLVGIPGNVKTTFYRHLASFLTEKTGKPWSFEWFVASQMQPEEISGVMVPNRDEGLALQLPLHKVKRLSNVEQGICLLDELNLSSRQVGSQLMTFIQDHLAGSTFISPNVAIVGAMNPTWAGATARRFSMPEANRLSFIPWVTGPGTDTDDVIYQEMGLAYKRARADYLRGGKGLFHSVTLLPDTWVQFRSRSRAMMASFEEKFPHFTDERALPDENKIDDGSEDRSIVKFALSQSWASSRSLENAADVIAALMALDKSLTGPLAKMMLAGTMGETAATVFQAWVNDLRLPDTDKALLWPVEQLVGIVNSLRPDLKRIFLDQLAAGACVKEHNAYKERWLKMQAVLDAVYPENQDIAMTAAEIMCRTVPRNIQLGSFLSEHYKVQEQLKVA